MDENPIQIYSTLLMEKCFFYWLMGKCFLFYWLILLWKLESTPRIEFRSPSTEHTCCFRKFYGGKNSSRRQKRDFKFSGGYRRHVAEHVGWAWENKKWNNSNWFLEWKHLQSWISSILYSEMGICRYWRYLLKSFSWIIYIP